MVKKIKRKQKPPIRKTLILTLILILIICIGILFLTKIPLSNNNSNTNNEEDIIKNILTYKLEESVNISFLEWISKEYSIEVLKELEKYLQENNYNPTIWHQLTNNSLIVLQDKYNAITSNRIKELTTNNTNEITLSFVGDISLADNWYIMPKYDERGKKIYGILSKDVVDIMTDSDIMVANNEFTISNRGEKLPNKYYTFRASPDRLAIYQEMGIDLVTLANNHVYDFGEEAFNDTLEYLEQYKIPYIGAGRNIEEAKAPFYYIINGYKIAFVNANRSEKYILTPEANETSGGVLRCYDPTTFINVISNAKQNSDFVIALVHWGKEDSSELEQVQIDTSKQYIDAGADIIIGTHAHTLQGIDFYNNKAIIYNLGDFIFNNETKDTAIFQLKIDSNGNFTYYFLPCKEENEYTSLLTGSEQVRVLNKIRNLSPNITINEAGEITSNNTN